MNYLESIAKYETTINNQAFIKEIDRLAQDKLWNYIYVEKKVRTNKLYIPNKQKKYIEQESFYVNVPGMIVPFRVVFKNH